MNRTLRSALISLIFNIAYSAYYVVLGALTRSWWLLALGFYYYVLSTVRFIVIRTKKNEHLLAKFTGVMLIIMSLSLIGVVLLSLVRDRGHKFHIIVMITIAAYSFAKIVLAVVKLVKSRHSKSQKTIALRNISFAAACVSIFSLQRSMLVSFEGVSEAEIPLMNALTGTGVCIIIFLLGLNLAVKRTLIFKALDKREHSD